MILEAWSVDLEQINFCQGCSDKPLFGCHPWSNISIGFIFAWSYSSQAQKGYWIQHLLALFFQTYARSVRKLPCELFLSVQRPVPSALLWPWNRCWHSVGERLWSKVGFNMYEVWGSNASSLINQTSGQCWQSTFLACFESLEGKTRGALERICPPLLKNTKLM
jgi:hypothetical protein